MTSDESETLSATAKRLLELERGREGPTGLEEQRVFEALIQAQAFQPLVAAAGAKAVAAKVILGIAAGAIVGGGAVGAWFKSELEQTRAALALAQEVSIPVPVVASPVMAEPVVAPAEKAVPPSRTSKPKAVGVASPSPQRESLSEEAALIDQARTALLKNNLEGAAAALAQHEVKFPSGRMVEERQVMEIQVWLGQGHEEKAQALRIQFHQRYPDSLMGPTVDALFEPQQ